MTLEKRISILEQLGRYMQGNDPLWEAAKTKAEQENPWFTRAFIHLSVKNIAEAFLQPGKLKPLAERYHVPEVMEDPKTIGLVLAGNIPLVGFHDLLMVLLSGHKALIKLSSKDTTLMKHLADKMVEWEPSISMHIEIRERLQGADAFIATGSNNTSRYFEHYFGKYPNIIRKNRTSVAILDGTETASELEKLSDDVCQFFGLGCRNVTKIYVPANYNFQPLIDALKKYDYLADHTKFKNNYDYYLTSYLLNKKYFMAQGGILLVEDPFLFSPISVLNYEFYQDKEKILKELASSEDIQVILGHDLKPFGTAQVPALEEFADGVDTLLFLLTLNIKELRRP